jgi:peptidoglycan/LPS O-acetylase OafA/YrhL
MVLRPRIAQERPLPQPRGDFRPDIQGLRALAVVLVILDHAHVPGFEGGFIGVDIFFVISGYVITNLLRRQPADVIGANLRSFYTRRICRIVPVATVVLIATTVVTYLVFGPNMDQALFGDVRWSSMFAANFRFIHTATPYNIAGIFPSLVNQYWSLAVEEQFYLVFPLIVFTVAWLTPPKIRTRVIAGVVISGLLVSASWSAHVTPINSQSAYYSPFTRFWELALGAVIALIPVHLASRTPRINRVAAVAALVVIFVCVFALSGPNGFPGMVAWWPCGAAAVLIWTGTAGVAVAPWSWLARRPVTYVGDISYSLYLFHFAWLLLPLELTHPPSAWWAVPLELLGATACSVASYHLIENPIRHSRRLRRDFVTVLLFLVASVTAVWATTFVVARLANGG